MRLKIYWIVKRGKWHKNSLCVDGETEQEILDRFKKMYPRRKIHEFIDVTPLRNLK